MAPRGGRTARQAAHLPATCLPALSSLLTSALFILQVDALIRPSDLAAIVASAGRHPGHTPPDKPEPSPKDQGPKGASRASSKDVGPEIVEHAIDAASLGLSLQPQAQGSPLGLGGTLQGGCPGCLQPGPSLGHSAGFFRLPNRVASRLFYLYFQSRSGPHNKDPLILWLTGGPGCSSTFAAFFENGPYSINRDNATLSWNGYGWDRVSNIIFLDQPVGTGFSYTTSDSDYATQGSDIGEDVYVFMQEFFKVHTELLQKPFFIVGESYAGHYIPVIAQRILKGNSNQSATKINLQGIALGNPWTNPLAQNSAYADFCWRSRLMSASTRDMLNSNFGRGCGPALRDCAANGTGSCVTTSYVCNVFFNTVYRWCGSGDLNYYDIRQACALPSLGCYDFSSLDKFMSLPSVRTALGVPADVAFESCSATVAQTLAGDDAVNVDGAIPGLLAANVATLVYVGGKDLICNWLGNWRWVSALDWRGRAQFRASRKAAFRSKRRQTWGDYFQHGPLTFLKVYNSGHMVPRDQPRAALSMIYSFTRRKNLKKPFL